MNLDFTLRSEIQKAIDALFRQPVGQLQIQPTNAEFEGSHTLVCFPLVKISKRAPEATATALGEYLVANSGLVSRFNVVKGFLNMVIEDRAWIQVLQAIHANPSFGFVPPHGRELMVEYSSPNTNKPLHLGHLRNNFLGYSVAEIYKALGYTVHKVQIINDRGIHICKSMAAWQAYGNGVTPETSGLKGDKLVGRYYVEFDKHYRAQVKELMAQGVAETEAEKQAPIMKAAVDLLQKWEAKDPDVLALWQKMNGWVYAGFEATYQRMGVDFDKLYFESETYLSGKDEVLKGVENGTFIKKEDGSVWVDLTADGLDQKVLLRSDGTSVYMTQDIGTAILRFRDFPKIEGQVYTVGNEQEYHFKVLFLILKKLGFAFAEKCYHLSYGMVDLPTGKMKSREGTVVDADDLMEEMVEEATQQTHALGKVAEMTPNEIRELTEMIGLGALKFFLLKVDPQKRMLFDPNESIQLQGHTGPFIQYTHARIRSILRKAAALGVDVSTWEGTATSPLEPAEREVIFKLNQYPQKIHEAAREYSPAVVANYAFELAKGYNQFYQTVPIFQESDAAKLQLRVVLSHAVADVLKKALRLLGMQVPERM
ncbi:MAG: arginine--tRNA ligase [Cyclobacteriaceae bacterium]|jgi:arginyl-tRNA synthetase|nr:arginine--tRNA ligase [Cyclobacteriaceae bacterium]